MARSCRTLQFTALERFVISCVAVLGFKPANIMRLSWQLTPAERTDTYRTALRQWRQQSENEVDSESTLRGLIDNLAHVFLTNPLFNWYSVHLHLVGEPGQLELEIRETEDESDSTRIRARHLVGVWRRTEQQRSKLALPQWPNNLEVL